MTTNFQKSEYIVYDNAGVCLIENIGTMKFEYWDTERLCYILRPIGNRTSVVYVPVDNEKLTKKMRYIMSKDEINATLDNARSLSLECPEDRRQRAEQFRTILSEKKQQDMLLLASCIYTKKQELMANGKKLSSSDEMILRETERFVNEEFAFSLELSPSQVSEYIQKRLGLID